MKHNESTSGKNKAVCRALNHFEHFLIFVSLVIGCVPISAFASLVDAPVCIKSSALGLKFCALTVRIKKYKLTINKKRKKYDKILLLA